MRTAPLWLALSVLPALADAATTIIHARIVDGSGGPLREASVRIDGDRIIRVGSFKPGKADRVIDGAGLMLAPGFIDTHNHSTEGLDQEPAAISQVSQGITTMVLGPDGESPWPVAEYLDRRRAHPTSVNVALLVGHATVRSTVMGDDYRRAAKPEEIAAMEKLVEQAMKEGAIGLSTGLEYDVGSYSTTDELVALARVAARFSGLYMTHIRDEADRAFEAFREAIAIGEQAHIAVQISHIKLGTAGVWGKAAEVVNMIEQARVRGVDVTADCYPYDAWHSGLTVLIPNKRYDDPASVERGLADVGGAANITITSCAAHKDYEFRTLQEIARSQSITPVELFIRIVKQGGAGIVCKSMIDEDIRTFFQQPWVMVASDGGIGAMHPRGAGTYPRVLGVFVRERHWLSLPEAIRKMTSLPATRLKLTDRGTIRAGAKADLVLFNPDTVIDQSTFSEPLKLSVGIEKTFVNGQLVWDAGKPTAARPGIILAGSATPNPRAAPARH